MGLSVGFGGFPVVGDFHEDGGDEAQATFWRGEDADDASSAADLFVGGFGEVGGAQAFADGFWEGEDGEGEQISGCLEGEGVKDGADVGGDGIFHFLVGDVGLGVLLEVELAAIPGDGWEDGAEGGFESFVGVAGNGSGDGESAFFEAGEELAPVDFGFGEGDGGAEDGAFAVGGIDADGG